MRYFLFLFLVFSNTNQLFAQAQEPNIHHLDINKDKPGAEYSFSFIHLTDVHIGEGDEDGDYGTPGFNDTMPIGDVGDPAIRLRKCVDWINENYLQEQIEFIIVSGDLTDSGERSEFLKFKEIMDELKLPYIPLIGNHDVWPYTKNEVASYPFGDSLINEIFDSTFINAKAIMEDWDDGTRLTKQFNPESNNYNYLQNYSFQYNGFHFLMTDFDTRHPADNNEPGIGPMAELMDFEGGSWDWMKKKIQSIENLGDQNVFVVSHHPPLKEIWSFWFAFDIEERTAITDFLWQYKSHIAVWLAGHIHRSIIYHVTTTGLQPYQVFKSVETAANKEYDKGLFRKVNVYQSSISTAVQEDLVVKQIDVYPNPSSGQFQIFIKDNHQKKLEATVYEFSGKKILAKTLDIDVNSRTFLLDLRNYPKGIYRLKLISKDLEVYHNLIIQ